MATDTTLRLTFSGLGMDNQFIRQAELLGFHCLGDILNADLERLKQQKEFTYTWYADMLNLLKQYDLLSDFQEKQL
jgi:hypothetical protein